MGRRKFNKKQAVRFALVPSKDENGNPVNLFKPVETNNKLSESQRKKIINTVTDYEIQIDGKQMNESQIPAFILEQIKGRADLVFNHKNPDQMFEDDEEGMMYEEEDIEDIEEDEWEDEDEGEIEDNKKIQEKEQKKEIVIDGETYFLTKKQIELLDEAIPTNYQKYTIDGVEFIKYDDDGNRLDRKATFEKYLAEPEEKRAAVDSYDYVPEKPLNIVDNDLNEEEITGDMKEVQDALNYADEDGAYEELQDDFFTQLLAGKDAKKPKSKTMQKPTETSFKKKKNTVEETKVNQPKQFVDHSKKWDEIDEDHHEIDEEQDYQDEQEITDQMVDKAIEEFDKFAEMSEQERHEHIKRERKVSDATAGLIGMELIKFIQSREECIGRDGELDWRTLTKKEKKQYMKNKKIKGFFEEVRQRQISQKMQGKTNVKPQQLHLKQYIEFIPYEEDHVIQEAIKRDAEQAVDMEAESDYETESDEDDIISYRAKTSIISSGLATVEEPPKKKKKNNNNTEEEQVEEKNIQKVKVVPERRNKNETKEERKERKEKLKQMKKDKRGQKQEFNSLFEEQRKKQMKKNPQGKDILHKVSYVKIM